VLPTVLVSLKRVDRFFAKYDFDCEDSVIGKKDLVQRPTQRNFDLDKAGKWLVPGPRPHRTSAAPPDQLSVLHRPAGSRSGKGIAGGVKIAKPVLRKGGS
jgi:hypothetical protein